MVIVLGEGSTRIQIAAAPWHAPGQTVWKIVTCTSMSEDGSGIREVAEIIDEAKKVGWEDLPESWRS